MSATRRNNKTAKANKNASNKAKQPKTQAEWYAHAWQTLFNKLPKDERAELLVNLQKKPLIIRDREVWEKDVRSFVKRVVELGEELFDKSIKGKKAAPASAA